MKYKRPSTKYIVMVVIGLVILTSIASAAWLIGKNKVQVAKPNSSPGSGKVSASAAKQAEQKQQAKSQVLAKKLAEAPKDPKVRCEITAKFNAEQQRDELLEAENKRHEAYIKKFGNTNAETYIHKQNQEKLQKQYTNRVASINCK